MAFPGVSRVLVAQSSGLLCRDGLPFGAGDGPVGDDAADSDGEYDEGSDVDYVYGVDEDFG